MRVKVHNLGSSFELRRFFSNGVLIGYTVTGPAAPNCKHGHAKRCGGLCAIRPYSVPLSDTGLRRTYSVWGVTGHWPRISLSPSVACDCNGQHGFVRDGHWINAGGVVGI